MHNLLNHTEFQIMELLINGYESNDITVFLNINYCDYVKAKNKILRVMRVKRITQILPVAIEYGII